MNKLNEAAEPAVRAKWEAIITEEAIIDKKSRKT